MAPESMSAITAKAYVADNHGYITLYKSDGWSTTSWVAIEDEEDFYNPNALLYTPTYSGTGTLSSNGKNLFIYMEHIPYGDFALEIGTFTKYFNLSDGVETVTSRLVATGELQYNDSDPNGHGNTPYLGPNLVLFADIKKKMKGGALVGYILKDNVLMAYASGVNFFAVQANPTGHQTKYWIYSGIIFNRFLWLTSLPGDASVEYSFYMPSVPFQDGDGPALTVPVTISATSMIAQDPNFFTVNSSQDNFSLHGRMR